MNMERSLLPKRRKVKKKNGPSTVGVQRKKRTPQARSRPRNPKPQALLAWYDRNRRILPWRALPGVIPDPYRVWLSEIMLQQTTVAAVGPYFQKFLRRWPTIRHLAKASIDEVRQMWAGLGYYRRAQSLHECAVTICADYDGQFPESEAELLELPGFGPYTAAAVTTIAFGQRANVVDGNVERVMARIFAIETPLPKAKAEIREMAKGLLPSERHGDYAQALMDLGATICTPRNPKCGLCPWAKSCRARAMGLAEKLPRRTKAKAKPVRRAIAFVLTNSEGKILLRQRPKQGLLGGMMEVPSSPWAEGVWPEGDEPASAHIRKHAPVAARWRLLPGKVKHVFSHFELELVVATATKPAARGISGVWVAPGQLKEQALPSIMLKIARHALGLV